MKYTVLSILILCAALSGCRQNNNAYAEQETKRSNSSSIKLLGSANITFADSVNEMDYINLKHYLNYYYFYNSKSGYLETIDDKSTIFKRSINLNLLKYGGEVYDVLIQHDTLIVLQSEQLCLLNMEGKIINSWTLITDTNSIYYYGRFSDGYPVCYDAETGNVYMQRYNIETGFNYAKSLNSSIEACFNIYNSKADTLPVYASQIYTCNLGEMFHPNRIINKGTLIYSFPPDPNLYMYKKNAIRSIGCKSIYQQKSATEYSSNDSILSNFKMQLELLITLPQYTALQISDNGYMYRMFVKEIAYKNKNGLYNTFRDKKCYLMKIDSSYTVIAEKEIPNKYLTSKMIQTNRGIGIVSKTSATGITFDIYE